MLAASCPHVLHLCESSNSKLTESTRGHVRRDQDAAVGVAEPVEGALALLLALVAVHADRVLAEAAQVGRDLVALALRRGEDQDLAGVAARLQVVEQFAESGKGIFGFGRGSSILAA